jgi:opacity protein-like surface antigen
MAEFFYDSGVEADSGSGDVDFNTHFVGFNVKGYPLSGRFQPYAIGGAGLLGSVIQGDSVAGLDDDQAFTWRVGAGVDLYTTEHVLLSLEGAYYFPIGSDFEDFNFVSVGLGLQYRF